MPPKWGFLPSSKQLSLESKGVKTRYCRFCLHQHHRAADAKHHETDYCPLDLYSGNMERLDRALNALHAHWRRSEGSGNQLRVFLNSKLLRPSEEVRPFLVFDSAR